MIDDHPDPPKIAFFLQSHGKWLVAIINVGVLLLTLKQLLTYHLMCNAARRQLGVEFNPDVPPGDWLQHVLWVFRRDGVGVNEQSRSIRSGNSS